MALRGSCLDDRICQDGGLLRSGDGKFCSAGAKRRFAVGFQSLSKGNVYHVNAGSCLNPPISRIDGVNKTIEGAKKTIEGANQTIGEANQTIDGANGTVVGAKKTSDRARKTIGAANKTEDGVMGIVSRANIIIDEAKISSMLRNARHRHQVA